MARSAQAPLDFRHLSRRVTSMASAKKSRRSKWRGRPKRHRNYTVYELAELAGVHRGTVLRWIREGKLPVLRDQKPMLILGTDCAEFWESQRQPKAKCSLNELYCFTCKAPRKPAFETVEYRPRNDRFGTIRALCCECATVTNKGFSASRLGELESIVSVSIIPAPGSLVDTSHPIENVQRQEAPRTHA